MYVIDVVKIDGSIEFRDAVMSRAREGKPVYVRKPGETDKAYRVISGDGLRCLVTIQDLFGNHFPPVQIETFAKALVIAKDHGESTVMEVFTL